MSGTGALSTEPNPSTSADWDAGYEAGVASRPVTDWETKFERQVTANIRHKAKMSEKLAEAQLELDQALGKIRKLEAEVKKLKPAGEKLVKCQAEADKQNAKWAETVAEKNARIARLTTEVARGQRAVLEQVIGWLQGHAAKLPEPELPEPPEIVVEAVFS